MQMAIRAAQNTSKPLASHDVWMNARANRHTFSWHAQLKFNITTTIMNVCSVHHKQYHCTRTRIVKLFLKWHISTREYYTHRELNNYVYITMMMIINSLCFFFLPTRRREISEHASFNHFHYKLPIKVPCGF